MWLSPDKTNQPLYLQILGARLGFQDGLLGSACVVAVNILAAFPMVCASDNFWVPSCLLSSSLCPSEAQPCPVQIAVSIVAAYGTTE